MLLAGHRKGSPQLDVFRQRSQGQTMVILHSFVVSCELLKPDPFAWFRDVLSRISICSMQSNSIRCCHTLGPLLTLSKLGSVARLASMFRC
ncbi:MAG: transposase domain-containing protein [Acidobacteriaceae bacterium]|nr:transposase domain-containing protein [Acidobacteriaceae bacterium]